MQANKKRRTKTIKVYDSKTAIELMEYVIQQSQKLEKSVASMKNLAYQLQTYTMLQKNYKEEVEVNEIIEFELMKHRNELSILLNGWRTVLEAKLGDELYRDMLREYNQLEKQLDEKMEQSRKIIHEQVKKRANYKVGNKTSNSPSFITEAIKETLIHLPHTSREEILNFLKNRV